MKVYISGKIGEDEISDATYRKFLDAQELLDFEGYEQFNPCSPDRVDLLKESYAEHKKIISDQMPGFYTYCLLRDLMDLSLMDAICMLPDWKSSPGAKAELAFAQAIGLKVLKITNEGQLKE